MALAEPWEQKMLFVREAGRALWEMRGDFGPHARSFPDLSGDLIITFISRNAFMALCHWWEKPAVWSWAPPGTPKLMEGRSWSLGTKQPKAVCEGQSEVWSCNGRVGKCDQKPGLEFTGKMILPEKEILFKKAKEQRHLRHPLGNKDEQSDCGFSLYNRTLYSWRDLFIWFFALSDSSRQCTQNAAQKRESQGEITGYWENVISKSLWHWGGLWRVRSKNRSSRCLNVLNFSSKEGQRGTKSSW